MTVRAATVTSDLPEVISHESTGPVTGLGPA
jgi:hypothetical protein